MLGIVMRRVNDDVMAVTLQSNRRVDNQPLRSPYAHGKE